MEDLLHLFRKFRKPHKGDASDDLEAEAPHVQQQATFKLKRPRLSPTERKILGRKSKERHSLETASSASSSEVTVAVAKCRAGSPFADEDDLFADRDQDDGVYMQSSSSSSPTASTSERLRPPMLHASEARPVSCTFGQDARLFQNSRTFLNPSQGKFMADLGIL